MLTPCSHSRLMFLTVIAVVAMCVVSVPSSAQSMGATLRQTPQTDTADVERQNQTEVPEDEPALGVAAFGVTAGFPAYRAYALSASLQYRFVGVALRTTWTDAAGAYAGVQVRGYPPIPGVPVPVYAGAGFGGHSAGAVPFATLGAHVPVSQNWRIDVEAGAAWPPLLNERHTTPYLTLGMSYAFAVDLGRALERADERRERRRYERLEEAGRDCGLEADPGAIRGAVSDTINDFIRDARASYGSLYRNLRYSYDVTSVSVDGERARVSVDYEGSVEEIASGERSSASGTAEITYRWNGCSWGSGDVSY